MMFKESFCYRMKLELPHRTSIGVLNGTKRRGFFGRIIKGIKPFVAVTRSEM